MLGFDAIGKLGLGELPEPSGAAQTTAVNPEWPDIVRKSGLAVAVVATTFVGFVAPPPAQARVFSEFSRPAKPKALLPSWHFTARATVQPAALFSRFDQMVLNKAPIPDEQPSAFFEIAPPTAPPFTGFATFPIPFRAKITLGEFKPWPIVYPVKDTHDLGVFVKKKRKGSSPDRFKDELDIKIKRRLAIYDALHPEVSYTFPDFVLPSYSPPPKVDDLASLIVAAQRKFEETKNATDLQADEDDIEQILKDIL